MLAGPLGGCTVGPDYTAAAAPTPTKFKELAGWKVATPSDGPGRGEWWTLYRDAKLDFLIKQIEISNQTVAADAAAYEQARALIREAQAGLFPVLTGTYQGTRTRTGVGALGTNGAFGPGIVGTSSDGGVYSTNIEPQLAASWDLDVWGKVRRQIESNTAAAQASAATLAYAKLSEQALLATAYFNLRTANSLHDLLDRTVKEYKKTLDIVQNQFKAGYSVTAGDVATARAQVETAQAQEINVGVHARAGRARDRHAGRPTAGRTRGRVAPALRHDSEDPGCGALDPARTPSRHRRGRTHDAGRERADRRRDRGLLPRHQPVRAVGVERHQRRFRSPPRTKSGCSAPPARRRSSMAG